MREKNVLYFGDNLKILDAYVGDETVDLVYLDPPFKSNQDYNVLFEEREGGGAASQIKAFEDTWRWDRAAAAAYEQAVERTDYPDVARALQAFRLALGETDMLAYLSMMTPRLLELRRVLKPTGSLYLHCDPTASHYLKALLDAVFGPSRFWNEIIWKRTSGHSDARRYGRVHDVLLYYSKGDMPKWNKTYQPYDESYIRQYYRYKDEDGRRFMSGDLSAAGLTGGGYEYDWKGIRRVWRVPRETMERLEHENRVFYTRNGIPRVKRYLDEAKGLPVQDVWTDIEALRSWHAERLGYPTQKPEALLERIIRVCSNEGDVVLDPFCGCGTAVAVAHRLRRRWIGIDVTHLALGVIRHRLRRDFEDGAAPYRVVGEPESLPDAGALADESKEDFQAWVVGKLGINPIQSRRGPDRGIDGRLYFHERGDRRARQIIVSVKGGKPAVTQLRDLLGVVERERADIGVFVTLHEPTKPMRRDAAAAGFYESSAAGLYPRIQILTVEELLAGKTIEYPSTAPGLRPADVPQPVRQLVLGDEPEDDRPPKKHDGAPLSASRAQPRSTSDLVDDLLERARINRPPVRLEPILEELKMELSPDPRLREDALLVPMTDPRYGPPEAWTVYYNPGKPETRRRFTIAHEVGHVLLHGTPVSAQARGAGARSKSREREVERFAAELLMPRRMVRAAVDEFGADAESLRSLFQVSRAAMDIRLRELGFA